MLNQILFSATTAPASEAPDGETPEQIHLTEEANGYAIWLCNFWEGETLIEFIPDWKTRSKAIREAVLYTVSREQYRARYSMKEERADKEEAAHVRTERRNHATEI